jgi:hypothetical protein
MGMQTGWKDSIAKKAIDEMVVNGGCKRKSDKYK